MTDTKHTPTPWWIREVENSDSSMGIAIMGENLHVIADDEPYYPRAISRANAAHIVKCVNMHEELLEVLSNLYSGAMDDNACKHFSAAYHALKKAGAL